MAWIAALVLSGVAGTTDYDRYHPCELAAYADRVVAGRIVALDEQTFDLEVERTLVGPPGARLRIRRFGDWICAARHAPYALGQRTLVFLREGRVLGGGNEGEWPLVGEGVLVPFVVRGSRYVDRPVHGGELRSSWIPLDDVAAALEPFRACFEYSATRGRRQPANLRLLAGADELRALESRSSFARSLVLDAFEGGLLSPRPTGKDSSGPPPRLFSASAHHLDDGHAARDGWVWPSTFGRSLMVRRGGAREVLAASGERIARIRGTAPEFGVDVLRDLPVPGGRRFVRPAFGAGLAPLGDLDGDGFADFAVTSGFEHSFHVEGEVGDHAGGLVLVSWPREGDVSVLAAVTSTTAELPGLVDGCRFGRSLCTLGDLDGDGGTELVLTRAPDRIHAHGAFEQGSDSVALVHLGPDGEVDAWSPLEGALDDARAVSRLASVLAGPGDVDGDGVPDLLIGEPLACEEGPFRGRLRLIHLTPAGEVRSRARIDPAPFGLADGDELGVALAPVGDVNGDGVPDLVVAGARDLWSVFLARDGSASQVRRFVLDDLLPGAGDPLALAAGETDADGTRVLVSLRHGTDRPRDVVLVWLRLGPDGVLRRD